MPDISQVLRDPKFGGLSPEVQRLVLSQLDDKFAGLSLEAQGIALEKLVASPIESGPPLPPLVPGLPEVRQPGRVPVTIGGPRFGPPGEVEKIREAFRTPISKQLGGASLSELAERVLGSQVASGESVRTRLGPRIVFGGPPTYGEIPAVKGMAKDAIRLAAGLVDFAQTPEGLAALGLTAIGGGPAVAAYFAGTQAVEIPAAVKTYLDDPTPENLQQALLIPGFVALLSSMAGKGLKAKAPVKKVARAVEPEKRPSVPEPPAKASPEVLRMEIQRFLRRRGEARTPQERELVEQRIAENQQMLAEVSDAMESQRGFIRFGGEPEKPIKAADPSVEAALTAQRQPAQLEGLKNWFGDYFVFEWSVREFPELKNELRLVKDAVFDAAKDSSNKVAEVVRPLTRREYELFRRSVVLKDFVESSDRGLTLPRNITLESVRQELSRVQADAAKHPRVEAAIERHQALTEATAKELVDRGKMGEETVSRAYFPHRVLDYSIELEKRLPNIPRRLKTPSRLYTKKRLGSVRDIDTDYMDVMHRHLSKIKLDNIIEDFALDTARKYDRARLLSGEEREALGVLRPGGRYTLPDGTAVKGWQLDPGNVIYRGVTVNEKLISNAIAENMTVKEWVESTGPKGAAATREAPVLGGRHKVYLLPEAIADRLNRFREPRQASPISDVFGGWMSLWKRITLDFAGIPFQLDNFKGDLLNLYKTDPTALLKVPKAIAALRRHAPETLKAIEELAYQQRVVQTSGLFGGEVMGQLPRPEFRKDIAHLRGLRGQLAYYNPLHIIEVLSTFRESVPRLAKFMTDVERINRGEMVRAGEIDIKGLKDPIAQAGKVAREFTVDYGAVTPAFQTEFRRMLFPFITFWVQNGKNYANYTVKRPGNAAVKFGIPLGMMWVWNNTGERREVEAALPEWHRTIPHIITGWRTSDGKPIIVAMQTPVDMAARMGGLDKIPMRVSQVRDGEMTLEEGVKETLKDIAKATPENALNLATPAYKVFHGLLANRDPFTKRTIVPERLKGTAEEKKLQVQYVLGQFITPYSQYVRATRTIEPGDTLTKMLRKGPFDIPRALGYREVDIGREALSRQYEEAREATAAYQEKVHNIEKAYVAWQTKAMTQAEYTETIQRVQEAPGPKIPALALATRLRSPRVQLLVEKEHLRQETRPSVRLMLQRRIRALEKKMLDEQRKRVPRGARGELSPGLSLEEIGPPPPPQ